MGKNLDLDDPLFWLPLEFLSDDDFTDSKKNINKSGLSSPVESVISSTETESDQDEFFTELSRRLAHSTYLSDKSNCILPYDNTNKVLNMATSPQSTLCNVMRGQGSSRRSPNCLSPPVAPPREAVVRENTAAKYLLYAAAEEVEKWRRLEEHFISGYFNHSVSVSLNNRENKNTRYYSNQGISYQHLQLNKFQQHQMRRQEEGFVPKLQQNGIREGRTLGLSRSAWPTLQQSQSCKQHPVAAARSGTKDVYFGNRVVKRQCSGTGVFLPRSLGTPTQTQKKSGCSVLHPERIVQAQNNVLIAQAHRRHDIFRSPTRNNEVQLPQEWTY